MKLLRFLITVVTEHGTQQYPALAQSSVDAVMSAAEQFGFGVKIRAEAVQS